ncbi:hypothetical protein [uncultured Thiodictyon sp.]|uniref:glucosamine inositolphosphorylceramide transferase family protein n=1 Tax=uncultured Thiodictyon sp. TaxID=1846217 RepID=UPI0025E93A13|nr:hypothetical protein [uncultured Thiodictyon sp.]
MNPLRRLHQTLARAIYKRRDERDERTAWPQWFLLAGLRERAAWCTPDPAGLTPLYPPADSFWADPFAWVQDGRRCIFIEEYPFHTERGRISVLELGTDLNPIGPAVPVIDEDRHLSYPFLFAFQGELYMVPESAASRRVDLYRCTTFPHGWTRVSTLIDGIQAADATLFEHQGRWWLLCSARLGKARVNDSLFAFHADSPLSDRWTRHAGNPLVRDFAGARPGGRVFVDDQGRLLRPAQVSVPRYGYGLALKQILELTPERFRERRIWAASGPASGGWRAMHHLDWHQGLMVMDAQRLVPRPD